MKRIHAQLIIWVLMMVMVSGVDGFAESVAIHGFITQGYLKTDKNNYLADTEKGSFEINEMGINFNTYLNDDTKIGIQFFARDLGDLGNDKVTVDWAYADRQLREWLGLRVGIMKIPHGFYNESRDCDMMRTSILQPQGVYNEPWRGALYDLTGVGIYGNLINHISYECQAGLIEEGTDGGMAKKFNDLVKSRVDRILGHWGTVMNVQCYDLIEGLRFGGSLVVWTWDMDITLYPSEKFPFPSPTHAYSDNEGQVWTGSIEYTRGKFLFSSEYTITYFNIPMQIYLMNGALTVHNTLKNHMLGYYYNTSYRFTEWFEAGLYYSTFYYNKDDRQGKSSDLVDKYGWKDYYSWSKDTCLSLRFDLNANWIFKLETHYNDGFYNGFVNMNMNDDGSFDVARYWWLFGAKIMFVF